MHISDVFFKKKPLFYFIVVSIIIGGFFSYKQMSKLEDPEIKVKQAVIVTMLPGASSHEVELNVTEVIENEIASMEGIENIKSVSSPNVSQISVSLDWTVQENDVEQHWDMLRRKVLKASGELPADAMTPIVLDDVGDLYGMFYAMTADGYNYEEMKDYAQYVKRLMLSVDGVSKVQIYGVREPVINIELSNEKMAAMGIMPFQVISEVNSQNESVYPSYFESGDSRIRVKVSQEISSAEALGNTVIPTQGGELIKLSDIAEISTGYSEPIRNVMYFDNEPAIGIAISMESGENIIDVGERVEKTLEENMVNLPVGVEFQKVFFQPEIVGESINGFIRNLIASVIVVIVVLMLSMGIRSGLIIGSGLVLTILATFPLLLVADGTLQRISLGAFIVAMGMLVDNAIVVIDGIIVDLQKGKERKKALIEPAKRTAMPLLGATIIAVATFLPIYLTNTSAGVYARDLFVVLAISLLASWVLAQVQVPIFSERFLKLKKRAENSEPFSGKFYQWLRRILTFTMKHKFATIAITVFLLIASAFSFKFVKQTFFPDFNYKQVFIEYQLPYGTAPQKVNKDLYEISEYLMDLDGVTQVVSSLSGSPARYCLVRPMAENNDSYGEIIIDFDDYNTMIEMKPQIESYLRENYPDAYIRIKKYNLSVSSSHLVEVEFAGPDPAVLKDLSSQAQGIMKQSDLIDTYTVNDDWQPAGKTLVAEYSPINAKLLGASRSDISNAILLATDGMPIGVYYDGNNAKTIYMMTRDANGERLDNINDIPVWNMIPSFNGIDMKSITGLMYGTTNMEDLQKDMISPNPISQLTNGIDLKWEEKVIRRKNGQRTIQAQCDPKGDISPAAARQSIAQEIENIKLPPGYSMNWAGEYELQSKGTGSIFKYFPISLIIILVVLILLFNDYKKPAIVILCLPLAVIGIVPTLILTGQPFTFLAIVGVMGLLGMLTKNIIVLLDEIENQIKEGKSLYEAIQDATIYRARPVFMASLTTILGMFPLIFDPMYSSMAISIMSGLLIGTVITLIFVPVIYSAFFKAPKTENTDNITY